MMQTITLKLKDGTTTTLEGEILKVEEVKSGHPYFNKNGDFIAPADQYWNALKELRRFQAMGELPVEGKKQWVINNKGEAIWVTSLDVKCCALSGIFPTQEAAEQALEVFGGWEHLRRVRREIHMVGGE